MDPMTDEEIRTEVEAIVSDPFFAAESPELKASIRIVIASCFAGTNADRIAKILKLNRDKVVRPRAKRLRDSGIWKDGRVVMDRSAVESDDDGPLMLGFVLAALVAEGEVVRHEVPFPGETTTETTGSSE